MISYTEVKDLSYSEDKNTVFMTVKFNHLSFSVLFPATATDVEPHGRELFERAIKGDFGPIAAYVPPAVKPLTSSQRVVLLRQATTEVLESKAKELGFNSIADAMTYVDEPSVPKYQEEALKLRAWRSLCWKWYDDLVASDQDVTLDEYKKSMPAY